MRLNLSMNPYLFGCGVLLVFWLVTLAIVWRHRSRANLREFWWGSFACSLLALTEPLFVPEYWNPPSVLSYRRWDLESFLFCFAIGGISGVAPEWPDLRKFFQAVDFVVWTVVRGLLTCFERLAGESLRPRFSDLSVTGDDLRRDNAILLAKLAKACCKTPIS